MSTTPPLNTVDRAVDTNVVSYLITSGLVAEDVVNFYRAQLDDKVVAISFQTWAELRVGAATQQTSVKALEAAVAGFAIVPHSDALLDAYVHLRAKARERNRRGLGPVLSAADGWVAAAAWLLNVPLVTHDRKLSDAPEITTITAHRRAGR